MGYNVWVLPFIAFVDAPFGPLHFLWQKVFISPFFPHNWRLGALFFIPPRNFVLFAYVDVCPFIQMGDMCIAAYLGMPMFVTVACSWRCHR